MSHVLVTGADGVLGRLLVSRLRQQGDRVTTVALGPELALGETELSLDLSRPDHLEALAGSGFRCDTVIHLAGRIDIQLATGATPDAPPVPRTALVPALYQQNVLATANVANFCLQSGVRHLVFASSQSVYGMPVERPLSEQSPCRPLEHYAASKLCAEQLLEVASRQGLAVTVLRCAGVFAEHRRQGVVRTFVRQALADHRIEVNAAYPLPLDVIHVDDVTSAFILAASVPAVGFRCLNVSTGEPCSLDLLADAVAALVPGCVVAHLGVPQPVVQLDNSAARLSLGWQPAPLPQRLHAMIAAVRDEAAAHA